MPTARNRMRGGAVARGRGGARYRFNGQSGRWQTVRAGRGRSGSTGG